MHVASDLMDNIWKCFFLTPPKCTCRILLEQCRKMSLRKGATPDPIHLTCSISGPSLQQLNSSSQSLNVQRRFQVIRHFCFHPVVFVLLHHESAPTGPILLFYFLLHSFCCMASLLCTPISCLWTQSCASSSAEHFPALAQIKSTAFAHGSHGNCRHWTTTNGLFNHAQLGHTTRSGSFPDIIQYSHKQALCPIS